MNNKIYLYYVEGQDEEKLVNVLKTNLRLIKPGKVQKINVNQDIISTARLRTISKGTIVVLVFDTDIPPSDVFKTNLANLKRCSYISKIVCIPQVRNLEEEIVRSCDITKITELLNSKSLSNFKHDFIHISNLDKKLVEHKFDINTFWSSKPPKPWDHIENSASDIKQH